MTHYSVTFRNLSNGVTGIVLDVLRDGVIVSRTNVAAAHRAAIMPTLNQIRHLMAAKGIVEAR